MDYAICTTMAYSILRRAMRNTTYETQQDDHQDALLHLKLEGLLPTNQELVVNPASGTAIVLSYDADGNSEVVQQQHFSPQGMRVLVLLLQTYPQMCRHEVLFAHVRSLPLDQAYQQMQESRSLTMPSLYNAISRLSIGLHAFGWEVVSVIGCGYLLHMLSEE
jgi:hypothetical protein